MKNPFRNRRMNPAEVKAIWAAPATFNRKARRSVGLLSRFWRWDLNAADDTRRTFLPRYIRRHYNEARFARPTTRRQRRDKARITRAMKGVS